ncbi:MAG: hypothetical protein KGS45_06200 [Planctomycetes bacterium]|nr:hypothetical protein [Planctomycetota bacterium]
MTGVFQNLIVLSIACVLFISNARPQQELSPSSPRAGNVDPFAAALRFEAGPVVDVIPGSMAVIVIDPAWNLKLSGSPSVRLDDGRTLIATLRSLVVRPSRVAPAWIGDPGEWSTTDIVQSVAGPDEVAFTADVLALELPADGIGQGVWIDGERIGLNWLKSSPMLAALSQRQGLEWPAMLTQAQREDVNLMNLLAPLSRSPMTRWRYRLLTDGLAPSPEARTARVQFDDPVLEALAEQQESAWRHGLAKIKEVGPIAPHADVAMQITRSLTQIVEITDDDRVQRLPCWNDHAPTINQLLSDLVASSLKPEEAAKRARGFGELSPRLIAWVVDDAASLHPVARVALPRIGAMNLSDRSTTLSAQIVDRSGRGGSPGNDLRVLPSRHGNFVSDLLPAPGTDLTAAPTMVLDAGLFKAQAQIQGAPISVSPPGLLMSGFLREWRQEDLIRESPQPRTQPGITATLSFRSATQGDDSPDSPSGWVLLCERQASILGRTSGAESFTLVWGPRQAESTITITREGDAGNTAARSVTDAAGNWFVEVLLPRRAVDEDGLAQIGVVWSSGDGVRASWPRSMLPQDASPGRALLNLGSW